MERASANRLYDLLHKARPFHDGTFTSWAEEPSASHPVHYRDGVDIWVSPVDLSPNDKFTTEKCAPAVAPATRPEGGDYGDEA